MDVIIDISAIVLLIAVNGFFVAAEFALVKARDLRPEAPGSEDGAAARCTRRIQGDLDAYLTTCQLGTTMASLGLGWVGASFAIALLEPLFGALGIPQAVLHVSAVGVGFLILSSIHLVIGRQVPASIAIRRSRPISLWVAYPLHLVHLAALPMNWLLRRVTRGVLRLFGANEAESNGAERAGFPNRQGNQSGRGVRGLFRSKEVGNEKARSIAALVALAKEIRKRGEIDDDEVVTLSGLFALDRRKTGDIMVPGNEVQILDLANKSHQNLFVICETEHSQFPLVDGTSDGKIIGVVAIHDVFNSPLTKREADPWWDLRRFCREPLFVSGAESVAELFELMRLKRTFMALVVDESNKLVGIVTLEDLLQDDPPQSPQRDMTFSPMLIRRNADLTA